MVGEIGGGRSRVGTRVDAAAVTAALERYTYSVRPSATIALARHLAETFPGADVRRGSGRGEPDVLVDDVGVVLVDALDRRTQQRFDLLVDAHDTLCIYSPSIHRERPSDWVEFAHRNRNRGRSIRFVTPAAPAGDDLAESTPAVGPAGTLALLGVVTVGLVGLLSASVGLFSTGGPAVAPTQAAFVGATGAVALAVALAGYWLHTHVTMESVLARLAQ